MQDEQMVVELAAAYREAGIAMPPDPQVSWACEKCHELLIEIRNSGVWVIRQRGLEPIALVDHGTENGVHRRTVRFYCSTCRQIVSYDEARLASV